MTKGAKGQRNHIFECLYGYWNHIILINWFDDIGSCDYLLIEIEIYDMDIKGNKNHVISLQWIMQKFLYCNILFVMFGSTYFKQIFDDYFIINTLYWIFA